MEPHEYKLFIGGEWVDSASGAIFATLNPATEAVIGLVPRGNSVDVDAAVSSARAAFEGEWARYAPKERAALLFETARLLRERVSEFAELETLDQGKPLQLARNEVLGAARYFEFYAGAADKFYGETIPLGPDYLDFTLREPLGVTAHIVPWNMPLNMLARSVAPALALGNTAVVKPAEQTPLTALKLATLWEDLGLPHGVYNVLTGYGTEAGAPLTSHPDIDGITFTGSVQTGQQVMRAAAENITPVVLELGGKSPHIIFADADLDLAVSEAAKGIYTNCGQICSAGSRLVIDEKIKTPFLEKFIAHSQGLRIGQGLDKPDLGPLNSEEHHQRVLGYVELGLRQGASLVYGGHRPDHLEKGYFMMPTIFDEVSLEMAVAQEEIFGPVVTVTTFQDEDEALAIGNGVRYGLVAGIFTNDINRALRLAKGLHAGQIYINEYYAGGEETPFGGVKQSGFGREKGLEALRSYSQVKNVAIRLR